MTVNDALEAYRRFAAGRYTDKREANRIGTALAAVADLYGTQPAASFRAKAMREVRARLLTGGKKPRSRRYVNKLARSIQTAWRWLACEELVPAEAAASVGLVRALGPGDGGVERGPVLPPPPGLVERTLPKCPPTVAAMVRVQLLTGMRPGEVCRMTGGEVSRDPGEPVTIAGSGRAVAALRCGGTVVWVYAPGDTRRSAAARSGWCPSDPKRRKCSGHSWTARARGRRRSRRRPAGRTGRTATPRR
jgi:integrase